MLLLLLLLRQWWLLLLPLLFVASDSALNYSFEIYNVVLSLSLAFSFPLCLFFGTLGWCSFKLIPMQKHTQCNSKYIVIALGSSVSFLCLFLLVNLFLGVLTFKPFSSPIQSKFKPMVHWKNITAKTFSSISVCFAVSLSESCFQFSLSMNSINSTSTEVLHFINYFIILW